MNIISIIIIMHVITVLQLKWVFYSRSWTIIKILHLIDKLTGHLPVNSDTQTVTSL